MFSLLLFFSLPRFSPQCSASREPAVALEASEFWGAVCEAQLPEEYVAALREFMPQVREETACALGGRKRRDVIGIDWETA